MFETVTTQRERSKEARSLISHVRLEGLLPQNCILALNRTTRTVSLLTEGPEQLMEQQLSTAEMCLMLPMVEAFPQYCPYEVLLAAVLTTTVTSASIDRSRHYLQEALTCGTWQQEIRPVRRALSSLRSKLHHFGLEISTIRQQGCCITSATSAPGSLTLF